MGKCQQQEIQRMNQLKLFMQFYNAHMLALKKSIEEKLVWHRVTFGQYLIAAVTRHSWTLTKY
ncbi:hypothetical protein ACJX0J_007121, partial [Zea mays]